MTFQPPSPLEEKLHILAADQEERLARHRATTLELPYISLVTYPLDHDTLKFIPKNEAQEAGVVVFYKKGKDIRVGVVNPTIPDVKKVVAALSTKMGTDIQMYVVSQRSLKVALSRYPAFREEAHETIGEMLIPDEKRKVGVVHKLEDIGQEITSLSPSELLTAVVTGALKVSASDIHIEPAQNEARLRYRIDGVLQDVTTFHKDGWKLVLSRIKVLSKLKLNVSEVPQDGSFVLKIGKEIFDIRVSTLPGGNGENIVMRILDRTAQVAKLEELGFKKRDFEHVVSALKSDHGLILVTGPTGSGKTTTLAAFLASVNNPEMKIVTLEDPIEYRLSGVEQTQVDVAAGYTFAKGLRSILRQDPDIIMVGEMRDAETAETSFHAAMTGHLVFSTLHTNNAASTVTRLIDIGIKPFVMAPALNLIIAQRLVRLVCAKCAEEYTPDTKLVNQIQEAMHGVLKDVFDPKKLAKAKFKKAKGCKVCHSTGYKGRVGIFEVLAVNGEIEEAILQNKSEAAIAQLAQKHGMTTLVQDAYLKVIAGETTIEEVERVTAE